MNDELPIELKSQINSYIVRKLIPTGVTVGIVGAVIGFTVNDWAKSSAYVEVLKSFTSEMTSASAKVGAATGSAEFAKSETERYKELAFKASNRAKKAADKTESLQVMSKELNDKFNSELGVLLKDKEAIKAITKSDRLKDKIAEISSARLDKKLAEFNKELNENTIRLENQSNIGRLISLSGLVLGSDSRGNEIRPFSVNLEGEEPQNSLLEKTPKISTVTIPLEGTYLATSTIRVCTGDSEGVVEAAVLLGDRKIAHATNRAHSCGSATATAIFTAMKGNIVSGGCLITQSGINQDCTFSLAFIGPKHKSLTNKLKS